MAPSIPVAIAKKSTRTPSIEREVNKHVENGKLGNRAVDSAFVKPVPTTAATWHTTQTDPNEHLTVEFKLNGNHVTTHHVYRTGD